jgi:predicted amidohydrolase
MIFTPEVTNCISTSRRRQKEVLTVEEADPTLARLKAVAAELEVWVSIGSLALKSEKDGYFVNRSFVIDTSGAVRARYDKIHMFDVAVSETETYAESKTYLPGSRLSLVPTPVGRLGLSVCYDIRFPHLYRILAKDGAQILNVPSAFSPVTGAAHWEPLLRARAIENAAFVVAAAQCGDHAMSRGRPRATYGHSMIVDPWGTVLVDMGTDPGVMVVDIDLAHVASVRSRLPSLSHDRSFDI